MKLKVKKLHHVASLPRYATPGSACFDVQTIQAGEVEALGGTFTFSTGLAFEVPEGHVMLVFSRSGHGFKSGIRLANCVGVIDSDYRGELLVKLHNDSPLAFGFEPGDRIAQALIMPVLAAGIVEVAELSETERGTGGFGSTGA